MSRSRYVLTKTNGFCNCEKLSDVPFLWDINVDVKVSKDHQLTGGKGQFIQEQLKLNQEVRGLEAISR